MNFYLMQANAMQEQLIRHRRWLHENAEVGLELPKTRAYVRNELQAMGYEDISENPGGIVCTVGSGDRTILLRADMDALPQQEKSGLPFACTSGACHSCGHDAHAAMLLGAAAILKEQEKMLPGKVLLLFQTGEEVGGGAYKAIDAGVMNGVHAAFGMHCAPLHAGEAETYYGSTRASIGFHVSFHGHSAHGATPEKGVSALSAAALFVTAAERLPAMEVSSQQSAVLSFGTFHAGTVKNICPDTAELSGTIRVFQNELGDYLYQRLSELASGLAAATRTSVTLSRGGTPSFQNDSQLVDSLLPAIRDICGTAHVKENTGDHPATDDFACFGRLVPSMMMNIGMQDATKPMREPHDPAMVLNEAGLPYGAAIYASVPFAYFTSHAADSGQSK